MDEINKTECGSATEDFRVKVKAKIESWFGGPCYEILFIWYDNYCAYATVKTEMGVDSSNLHFLRLFAIGNTIELSQDRKVEV